ALDLGEGAVTARHRLAVDLHLVPLLVDDDRPDLEEMLGFLDHAPTRFCIEAERAFLHHLEGGCQVPIAGYAQLKDTKVHLTGMVGDLSGRNMIMRSGEAKTKDARSLGIQIAEDVLQSGGRDILEEVYNELDQE
ncbi:MAG: hypothetical protein ACOC0U_03710, partial [Desulfovibrionales bacterium]